MLIFGGESKGTFQFDTREVQAVNRQAVVKTCRGTMSTRARFGMSSDWVARTFGNFVYCMDAADHNLHVFAIKDQSWNSQSLAELRIPR